MSTGELWVWLPRTAEGRLTPAAAELLHEGQALARRLGVALVAAGDRTSDDAERALLGRWGVARVRALGLALPPHPDCPGGASPLRPLLALAAEEGVRPRAVLLAADTMGRAVAPLVAAELDAACVTGASSVTSDGRQWVAARPTLGEQYEALVTLPLTRPLVATLRPGALGEIAAPEAGGPEPALVPSPEGLHAAAAPALLAPDPETVDLADAERIVAFGRGAFSQEAVALVERLARALGATVAGSRPAADEGWLPFARQVGLTGAIVRPRLYVAVGISGAPYHMAGIKDPELLVAINNDPEAPIFAHAHLGLLGDLHAVLPALLARLERGEGLPEPQAQPQPLPGGSR